MNGKTDIEKDLLKLKNIKKKEILGRFFKTGKGEYAEGDEFLGLTVPQMRAIACRHPDLTLKELQKLLSSKIHEYRLTALIILVNQYKKAKNKEKQKIVDFYLSNTVNINNWDLVDLSAYHILGDYFFLKDKSILYKLANSTSLWEKRIGIMSTYAFIKNNKFEQTFKIAEILLNDKHDLIHKAVGWMLREIGKRNQEEEEKFLKKYYQKMPRTMLRYAIEKFNEAKRKFYLKS